MEQGKSGYTCLTSCYSEYLCQIHEFIPFTVIFARTYCIYVCVLFKNLFLFNLTVFLVCQLILIHLILCFLFVQKQKYLKILLLRYVCACSYDACVCVCVCVCVLYVHAGLCAHALKYRGQLGEVCSPLISSQELDLGG